MLGIACSQRRAARGGDKLCSVSRSICPALKSCHEQAEALNQHVGVQGQVPCDARRDPAHGGARFARMQKSKKRAAEERRSRVVRSVIATKSPIKFL